MTQPLSQSLRALMAHQIFSPNTNVGKTLIAAALCHAATSDTTSTSASTSTTTSSTSTSTTKPRSRVLYLKPLQTGSNTDSDEEFVTRFAPQIEARTLFKYAAPVSPHLAAAMEEDTQQPVTDAQLVQAVSSAMTQFRESLRDEADGLRWCLVESAGGVLSPATSGTPQADVFRPMRLPAILIGDSKLGGISATLSAFESLSLRGYDVPCVVMFHDRELENDKTIEKQLRHMKVPVWVLPPPPPRPAPITLASPPPTRGASSSTPAATDPSASLNPTEIDTRNLRQWMRDAQPTALAILQFLSEQHYLRWKSLSLLGMRASASIWWPFTQHKTLSSINVIDSAYGDHFSLVRDGESGLASKSGRGPTAPAGADPGFIANPTIVETFDACGSWWTQGVGHGNPRLVLAAANAAGRYGHVLFPENAHEPAVDLAEMLLDAVNRPVSANWWRALPPANANDAQGSSGSGGTNVVADNELAPWATRVFFSDDGSTAMEIALKMAFRKRANDLGLASQIAKTELKVIGITNAYHGDTIGTMDAANPTVFNSKDNWYRGRGLWFAPPTMRLYRGQWQIVLPEHIASSPVAQSTRTVPDSELSLLNAEAAFDLQRDASSLAALYTSFVNAALDGACNTAPAALNNTVVAPVDVDGSAGGGDGGGGGVSGVTALRPPTSASAAAFGALVLEPIFQGAGGMIMIDPLFQRVLVRAARSRGIPVIFDEVFVGCYRLGVPTTSRWLGVTPDIACYGKLLTGGLVPLAATLATDAIFNAFRGDAKTDALLHGHSYTAHPVGCRAAVEALRIYRELPTYNRMQDHLQQQWDPARLDTISKLAQVESVVAFGSLCAVTMAAPSSGDHAGYNATTVSSRVVASLRELGVYARPLGNVVYVTASPTSSAAAFTELLDKLFTAISGNVLVNRSVVEQMARTVV
ncbi:hypothetical protein CAOG_04181 [Capsaspora owczarzaki ATCC 30864]|uniref:Adenosylmethionine-8-amino-7-oxononanoate aminotransferase n=1 Tax=Capsaspora owczarzaki (strain ATCC 30864) TaxID=595528 RepID=A0A0D2WQS2_CAPO3|nr:hypothetical protein CAOG_04181 [Capsaspora owczarzaki ATCC 30864]KJE93388.1 hypothetical protein CAOG_004181 [Capsaspora owczarzaki ATCC 30864]|eukprot:XP_004348006.1 hypothetical protein CAOG_04181 [Capsaspora owczarzaki ATCC 30864]